MANDKELTKLYKVRNGYGVIQGNKVIKEGNVALTDKEYALQSWKVEPVVVQVIMSPRVEEPNIDRSVKKSRTFNRVMKNSKE